MVGVAQSVEHQVVALDVAGSSPVTHPIYNPLNLNILSKNRPIAGLTLEIPWRTLAY